MPDYVYILTNLAMPGLVKVGMSTGHPEDRARELSRPTGVPEPFEVRYMYAVADCRVAERAAHRALDPYRTRREREFFQLEAERAAEVVVEAISQHLLQPEESDEPAAEVLTRVVPCPTCRAGVHFVDATLGARQWCVHGHVVTLTKPAPEATPAPSQIDRPPPPKRAAAAPRPACGICRRPLALLVTRGRPVLRCPDHTCYSRFPRTYPASA